MWTYPCPAFALPYICSVTMLPWLRSSQVTVWLPVLCCVPKYNFYTPVDQKWRVKSLPLRRLGCWCSSSSGGTVGHSCAAPQRRTGPPGGQHGRDGPPETGGPSGPPGGPRGRGWRPILQSMSRNCLDGKSCKWLSEDEPAHPPHTPAGPPPRCSSLSIHCVGWRTAAPQYCQAVQHRLPFVHPRNAVLYDLCGTRGYNKDTKKGWKYFDAGSCLIHTWFSDVQLYSDCLVQVAVVMMEVTRVQASVVHCYFCHHMKDENTWLGVTWQNTFDLYRFFAQRHHYA